MDILGRTADLITILTAAVGAELAGFARGEGSQRPSDAQFRGVRKLLKSQRRVLAELAYYLPDHENGYALKALTDPAEAEIDIPLLCREHWLPAQPVELARPDDELNDDSEQLVTTVIDAVPHSHLRNNPDFWRRQIQLIPECADAPEPVARYHQAIRYLENPNPEYFVNRTSYRVVAIESANDRKTLSFQTAKYFDYLDIGEVLCYELASVIARLGPRHVPPTPAKLAADLPLREQAAEWDGVEYRDSIAGINNLTIVQDGTERTFLMMRRGTHLGSAMGTYHVIPAGEFQPSQDSPVEVARQCTLWQTLVREFAEEILLMQEAKFNDKPMHGLVKIPPVPQIIDTIRSGAWRCWYLGTALDPLSLKPEIMTVSVIDKRAFSDLLRLAELDPSRPPRENGEGVLDEGEDGWGYPLTPENLMHYITNESTLPAAAGCSRLALAHMDGLRI